VYESAEILPEKGRQLAVGEAICNATLKNFPHGTSVEK
jgi:hypothetical protein